MRTNGMWLCFKEKFKSICYGLGESYSTYFVGALASLGASEKFSFEEGVKCYS